jgi:hypothetical protein
MTKVPTRARSTRAIEGVEYPSPGELQRFDVLKSELAKSRRNQVTSIQMHDLPTTIVGQADGHGRIGIVNTRTASMTTKEQNDPQPWRQQKGAPRVGCADPACFCLVYLRKRKVGRRKGNKAVLNEVSTVSRQSKSLKTDATTFQDVPELLSRDEQGVKTKKNNQVKDHPIRWGGITKPR